MNEPSKAQVAFIVGEYEEHAIGTKDCDACWPGYPYPCEEDQCGGLVHASFGDENYDGDYWLYTKCDRCGQQE